MKTMKKSLLTLSLAGAFVVSVFTVTAFAQTNSGNTPPTANAPGTKKERHPAIHAAIRSLEKARDELQHAAHDFGGHRVAALASCDKAIADLQLALQSDK